MSFTIDWWWPIQDEINFQFGFVRSREEVSSRLISRLYKPEGNLSDILLNQAVQVVETDIPNFLSWFRLKDGTLVGLTYIPQQETIAWHQHKIGGDYSYTNTRGGDPTGNLASDKSHAVVLDMCTIPSSTRDQLWMLVRRTIPVADSAQSKSHRIIESVEVMEDWMTTETISESKYLDGHVTHSGTNVASGELDHLEGETVGILSDGSPRKAL